jgi:hypothetical protein
MNAGWIGVDLDGTLAHYDKWEGSAKIGDPVPAMARRVEKWLEQGVPVKVFTARVWSDGTPERDAAAALAYEAIQLWCLAHLGAVLPVTCIKDLGMIALYDDRAVAVEKNTGRVLGGVHG